MAKAYVFIDNSNLFIRGKAAVAFLEDCGSINDKGTEKMLQELKIDYGQLLKELLDDRALGGNPLLVGSRPPYSDSLWGIIRKHGFDVDVKERSNIDNKEKAVDMAVGAAIMETVCDNDPGVLVLVLGDGDYEPVIARALKRNWDVEVCFWSSGMERWLESILPRTIVTRDAAHAGMASSLKNLAKHRNLDIVYRHFCFAYGPCRYRTHSISITDIPRDDWSDSAIFDLYRTVCALCHTDEFAWWHWTSKSELVVFFPSSTACTQFSSAVEKRRPELTCFVNVHKKQRHM